MPGWHETTRELQEEGKIRMVGIIQEQHPDRARLFMQWKQMEWPILVDRLNQLGVSVVPIVAFIDESGIVHHLRPSRTTLQEFLAKEPAGTLISPPPETGPPDLEILEKASRRGRADALRSYADALVLWGGPSKLSTAITMYRRALDRKPEDGPTHFRLGVAYRVRYDSDQRHPGDFESAVAHWNRALDLQPNQYIWRRRIQQYGPRLDKPYPFYDWVVKARREIEERGETPHRLAIEPGGAELARPSRSFKTSEDAGKKPDPEGRIHRDKGRFVAVETTAVPPVLSPGSAARVHLVFRPNESNHAHWNNEAGDLVVWIDPPEGWKADRRYHTVPNPRRNVSREPRIIELEIRSPEDADPGDFGVPAYALYYVCEGEDGTCLYRRQDLTVRLEVKAKTP